MGCLTGKQGFLSPARLVHPGKGHRLCHSTTPGSGPAGGSKPPASARPALGGRFSPAGSGAGLSWCPDPPVYTAPSRAGGETRCVSWSARRG